MGLEVSVLLLVRSPHRNRAVCPGDCRTQAGLELPAPLSQPPEVWDRRQYTALPHDTGCLKLMSVSTGLEKAAPSFLPWLPPGRRKNRLSLGHLICSCMDYLQRELRNTQSLLWAGVQRLKSFIYLLLTYLCCILKIGFCFVETRSPVAQAGLKLGLS